MKETEKKALEKAFGLPETEHKEEFFQKLGHKEKRRSPVIFIMRAASVAAMAVLALGLWGHFRDSAPPRENPTISDIIAVTTAVEETAPVTYQTTASPDISKPEKNEPSEVQTTAASGESPSTRTVAHTTRPGASPSALVQTAPARTTSPASKEASAKSTTHIVHTTAATRTQVVTTLPVTEPPIIDLTLEPFQTCEKKELVVDLAEIVEIVHHETQAGDPHPIAGEPAPKGDLPGIDPDPSDPTEPPPVDPMTDKEHIIVCAKTCDTAVIGEVKKVYYSDLYGTPPFTLVDLLVKDPLKGDIGENTLISIALLGGYYDLCDDSQFDFADLDDIYEEYGTLDITLKDLQGRSDEQDPQVGDTFIMFLYDNGRSEWFSTNYDCYSVIPFNEGTAHLGENSFTLDQIKEYVNS